MNTQNNMNKPDKEIVPCKIEINHVSKRFKKEQVLNDINLTLSSNKIYGFIGRNGSGKSVLFKLICGYLIADEGQIVVNGKVIGKDVDFPERLGALVDNCGFIWYQSGYSNLLYLAKIRHQISKDKIKNTLRMVGLDPDSKKCVGRYSLGMKQRLGIAQAIMEDPQILVLDEPMNGLDENGVDDIRKLILNFKGLNRIILLTSHNKEDIDLLCDEVFYLKNGNIIN